MSIELLNLLNQIDAYSIWQVQVNDFFQWLKLVTVFDQLFFSGVIERLILSDRHTCCMCILTLSYCIEVDFD
ncbi:hypothetical protein DKX38_014207 [Salix brachista]|uniref:Uncharacterized protein n=1 Tax=Salix brachista TaxID=2182728 RepID=A0A5N5LEM3_9ROSI|nr:hypothetical protein DKX38_014207 [Salix brachista]